MKPEFFQSTPISPWLLLILFAGFILFAAYLIINYGKNKTAVDPEELFIATETVIIWIYSCKHEVQLKLCHEAIEHLILDRYAGQVHADDLDKAITLISRAMAFQTVHVSKKRVFS